MLKESVIFWVFDININNSITINQLTNHNVSSKTLGPVVVFPDFLELTFLYIEFFISELWCTLDFIQLNTQGSGDDFIDKISFPVLCIFYHMGVTISQREVYVEIVNFLWNLFLQATFFLLDLYQRLMSSPVTFNRLNGLLEKERKILSLDMRDSQTLNKNMRTLLIILFPEDNKIIFIVKHLQQTLLIIRQLS